MQIVIDSSAPDWLTHVSPLLLRAEAENNLLIGLAAQAAGDSVREAGGSVFARVMEGAAAVGAAMITPYNLILSRQPDAALDALAEHLASSAISFPGVLGPDDMSEKFVGFWAKRTDASATLHQSQRIHECRAVVPVPVASGSCRVPRENEVLTLAKWRVDFNVAVNAVVTDDDHATAVRRMMRRDALVVWEDGGAIVSCAATVRRTANGCVIAFVYTPPKHRGRGYATSCVAELTRRELAAGAEFCCLYTDLANPVSNAIYARIGYRRVCDSDWWRIDKQSN